MTSTTRAWLVERDAKACGNYNCNDYRKRVKGGKFTLDVSTGLARYGCPTCGVQHQTQLRSWKERRSCKLCCYVRNVTVTKYRDAGEEHANEYCDACEALKSAWSHYSTGNRLKGKAQKLYEARGVDVPTIDAYRKVLTPSP